MPADPRSLNAWDPSLTYVVGHQRPDTDAIASALGYAWLLGEVGREDVVAARAGHLGPQTEFALERFEQAPPRLLGGVAATFDHVALPVPPVAPDSPLAAAVARLAAGERLVPVVDPSGRPTGAVTPLSLALALSAHDPAATLAAPVEGAAEALPTYEAEDRLADHRPALLRGERDEFLVVDGRAEPAGVYRGVAVRSRLLDPPRARLVLVDHNELSQAVAGAEEAEIVAVLDHHRLGNAPTALPIPFVVEPVGSTSTLVAERCRATGLTPPRAIAGLLLSGLLSDTLVFRSPTTTDRDRDAAQWLARLAGVDAAAYGRELLGAAPGLGARTVDDILDGDRKSYDAAGQRISVAQVEVTTLQELPEHREALLKGLDQRRERESLALAALLVTDVVAARSRLLCRGERRLLTCLPYARVGPDDYDVGSVISRKKQLVPALLALVEAAA